MYPLVDFAGAVLALVFRGITAPVLLFLYLLLAVVKLIAVAGRLRFRLPHFSIKWNRSFMPVFLKRRPLLFK